MRRFVSALIGASALLLSTSQAQVPAAQLEQPPANAQQWSISSTSATHGHSFRWTTPDGVRHSRETLLLRGFATDIDQQLRFGPDGALVSEIVRGSTPSGDAAESYSVSNGRYQYQSPVDHGEGQASAAFYGSYGGTLDANIALAEALYESPDHSLALLPSGRARMEPLATLQASNGHESKSLTAYSIVGIGLTPFPIWFEGDHFFGFASFLSYLPVGWESVAPTLTRAQDAALSARSRAMVTELAPKQTAPLVFQDVRLFDAEHLRFREHQSVVVSDGMITAVGAAMSTRAPAGATIIPGAGRTLVPGLWDSHQHYGGDFAGPLLLSQGITSVRDPGNDPDQAPARRARIERGELLGTRIVPSLLIDGEGPNTAQVAVVVHNEAEAVAAVQRAKREGYFAIKLYGTINPAWVAPMAAEAHKLGLHVHGHIPQGMRPLDAVRAGYDEITHINWVMMQAMPDSVIATDNGLPRFYGPGQYGSDVDLHSPEMTAYLDELQRRHIEFDPTLSTFEPLYTQDNGQPTGDYAPFEGTMPPAVERGFRAGGLAATPQISREQMRRGFAAMVALTGELHRRHARIFAGTDGTGLELVRELELYVQAGFTPAEALATATIAPSQAFGVGAETGSITVGKKAELFLVEGDPSQNIGDLRNGVVVMRDGRLMQVSALRAAVGISGPPHRVQ